MSGQGSRPGRAHWCSLMGAKFASLALQVRRQALALHARPGGTRNLRHPPAAGKFAFWHTEGRPVVRSFAAIGSSCQERPDVSRAYPPTGASTTRARPRCRWVPAREQPNTDNARKGAENRRFNSNKQYGQGCRRQDACTNPTHEMPTNGERALQVLGGEWCFEHAELTSAGIGECAPCRVPRPLLT